MRQWPGVRRRIGEVMQTPNEHGFSIAETEEDRAEFQRRAADLANYDGVTIRITRHPDNPESMAATVDVGPDSPCFLLVAAALSQAARQFTDEHARGKSPCRR